MANNYPHYNLSEWNCLKDDLAGPVAMWERVKMEVELQKLENEIVAIQSEPPSITQVRTIIEKHAVAWKNKTPKDNRQQILGQLVRELKFESARYQVNVLAGRAKVESLCSQIMSHYQRFDVKVFSDDFITIFTDQLTEDDTKERIEVIEKKMKGLKKKINDEWITTVVLKYFRKIPDHFRGTKVVLLEKKVKGKQKFYPDYHHFGIMILKTFVRDWRARAVQFNEPISITGISINSMPTLLKDTWSEAYKALELGRLVKERKEKGRPARFKAKQSEQPVGGKHMESIKKQANVKLQGMFGNPKG